MLLNYKYLKLNKFLCLDQRKNPTTHFISTGSNYNVCVTTSGCGEHLVRTSFARMCATAASNAEEIEKLAESIKKDFIGNHFESIIYVEFSMA